MKRLFLTHNLKMDNEPANNGGGDNGKQPQPPASQNPPQTETSGSGYSTGDEGEKPQGEQPNKANDKKDEKEASSTGYGENEEGAGDKPAADKPADDKKQEDKKLDYELDLKDVDAPVADLLKNFALKHNLSKDAAQALVELKKIELSQLDQSQKDYLKEVEAKRSEQRKAWNEELKSDKEFGGSKENFVTNIKKVDTVLQKFLPETNKFLTSGKIMLPPSTMKEIHALHKALLGNDPLVTGGEVNGVVNKIENFYKGKTN